MEKVLGQDEIDALFKAMLAGTPQATGAAEGLGRPGLAPEDSGGSKGAGAFSSGNARAQVPGRRQPDPAALEVYNFSRAGQISTDQMRAISTVNDLFARSVTHNLGAWLRTHFLVNLVSAEQLSYTDFLTRVPEMAYVCTVRLEPLGALAVLELDLAVAAPIIDLLLGGDGRPATLRELTEIEESILTSVVEILCRELTAAWAPVGLTFCFEKRELLTQVQRVLPSAERTLCVSFEIRMPEAQGMLNLSFPAVVSNTILRQLMAERNQARRQPPRIRERMAELLGHAAWGTALQFPPVRLRAQELVELAAGQVLRLALPGDTEAELRVGGLPLFRANPVRRGDHRAARLTSLEPARMGMVPGERLKPGIGGRAARLA